MFADGDGRVSGFTQFSGTLSLPAGLADVMLVTFPDRLANEAPPPLEYRPVLVRFTSGLAAVPFRVGDQTMLMSTERGTAYWLVSDHRDGDDLLRLANSLR